MQEAGQLAISGSCSVDRPERHAMALPAAGILRMGHGVPAVWVKETAAEPKAIYRATTETEAAAALEAFSVGP